MTSPTLPESTPHNLEGRSLRDVVEYSPEQVNDAWCHKILRKILQSLELQYAMQMPHRAITSDTVVFHANGEPLLISDDIDAAPAPDAQQADDLTALAGVIHYAITQELTPAGPLHGRVDGYSAALVATVDACMDPDPARRPRSIDAVRGLLGMMAAAPLAGAVTLPAAVSSVPHVPLATATPPPPVVPAAPVDIAMPDPAVAAPHAGTRRGRHWAIAAGGGVLAIALALVWFGQSRDAGAPEHIVQTPPQTSTPALPAPVSPAPMDTAAIDAPKEQAAIDTSGDAAGSATRDVASAPTDKPASSPAGSPASGASSGGATRSGGEAAQPDEVTRVAPKPAAPPAAVSANASYQLQIKPWGVVYVDDVERGVSPPLKRLALTPGPHTVRITNPKYRDSVLEFDSAQSTSNGKIIVDFDHDAQ